MVSTRKRLPTSRTDEQFWVVWRPSSGRTQYEHWTYKSAQAEAERLAKECPGEPFYVLKVMCGRICPVQPVHEIKVKPVSRSEFHDDRDDEIPF